MSSGTVLADHLITSERRAGGDRSPVVAVRGRALDGSGSAPGEHAGRGAHV